MRFRLPPNRALGSRWRQASASPASLLAYVRVRGYGGLSGLRRVADRPHDQRDAVDAEHGAQERAARPAARAVLRPAREARGGGYGIPRQRRDDAEALAFWESRLPDELLVPRLDTSVRGVQPLDTKGLGDIPSVGGKAAQLAELGRVPLCSGNVSTPRLRSRSPSCTRSSTTSGAEPAPTSSGSVRIPPLRRSPS